MKKMLNSDIEITKKLKDPYEVVCIDNFINTEHYDVLTKTFPNDFNPMPGTSVGKKYHITDQYNDKDKLQAHEKEYYNPDRKTKFDSFLNYNYTWRQFYNYVKSEAWVKYWDKQLPFLHNHNWVDTRFEFSFLPADGGHIFPHPDVAKKVITTVVFFPFEWDIEWGGGFSVHEHKTDPRGDFKKLGNGLTKWEDINDIYTAEFLPNRSVTMRRTQYSLHSVKPIKGPKDKYRTSLTINIIGSKK